MSLIDRSLNVNYDFNSLVSIVTFLYLYIACTKPYKEHDTSGQKRCMWDITNKKDPAALCAQKSSCNTVQLVEDEIGVGKKIYCVYCKW